MDKRIIKLRKAMIDHGVKPKDILKHFDWSWSYTSDLLRGKADASDEQVERVIDALPKIAKEKELKEIAA